MRSTERLGLIAGGRWLADQLVLALIVIAPLAIGTVHPTTRLVVQGLVALTLLLMLLERDKSGRDVPRSVPIAALLVAAGATALQLVPLPSAGVAALSPRAHEILRTSLGDYGTHSLSLDPAGTWAELAKLFAYAAFLLAATIYASRSHHRRRLMLAVVGAATLIALIGFAQAALGAGKILFFYTPRAQVISEILVRGTFVNPNHFGALMCLAAPCALVLALRERSLRIPAFIAVIILNVAAVLSLSRSALIVAPLGQLGVLALDRWQGRRSRGERGSTGTRVFVVVAVLATVVIVGSLFKSRIDRLIENTRSEASSPWEHPNSKLYIWKNAARLAAAYPWTGAGRGAFEQGFTGVADRGGDVRYVWAENGYLQALTDWGAPVAALLFVLAGWAGWLAFRRLGSDPLEHAALAGLLALAAHELVDFSVEISGIALPALALVAILFARKSSSTDRAARPRWRRALPFAGPLALAAAVLVAARMPSAEADADRIVALAREPSVTPDVLLAAARDARTRHPADYFLHAVVGERLARARHPDAMRWLSQAMALNPTHPGPHIVAAELLADHKRLPQALLEYRLAAAGRADFTLLDRISRRFPAADALIAATPQDSESMITLGRWLHAKKRWADADRVYARVLGMKPRDVRAMKLRLSLALDEGSPTAAQHHARLLLRLDLSQESRFLAARAALLARDHEQAAMLIDGLLDRSIYIFNLELGLADVYANVGLFDQARERFKRISWDLDRDSRIRLHEARGELERRAGNEHQYRWEMDQAARLKSSTAAN